MSSIGRYPRTRVFGATGSAALLAGLLALLGAISPAAAKGEAVTTVGAGPIKSAWPRGLKGPFELREVLHVRAPMSDGVKLEGWVGIPDLPKGVGAPTLVSASPYYGYCAADLPGYGPLAGCQPTPGSPDWWTEESIEPAVFAHWGFPPRKLVEKGFAVAFFSVRGTGNSGGCFDWFGPRARRDHGELVSWLARQDWSSGRVGVGGLSLPGNAALQAAVEAPKALKAAVVAGVTGDLYTFHMTPQGAQRTLHPLGMTAIAAESSLGGFARADDPPGGIAGFTAVAPERLCGNLDIYTQHAEDLLVVDRDAGFFDARRLADDLGAVTAPTLLAQGFFDGWDDDYIYQALGGPKRRIVGPWPHQFPTADAVDFPDRWRERSWQRTVIRWVERWVKGIGTRPRVGVVDYQDLDGTWRKSPQWPPKRSRREVLYLTDDGLSPDRREGASSFVSAPNILNSPRGAETAGLPYVPHSPLCPALGADLGTGLVFATEPAEQRVTVAGLPFLWLRVSSTQPNGMLSARIGVLGKDFSCDMLGQASGWEDAEMRAGGADLRFHAGNRKARPYPSGGSHVRIDVPDMALTLDPGERLAVELSYGELHVDFADRPPYPTLTIDAGTDRHASQLVLPVVRGTFGGSKPRVAYPPRPFRPGWNPRQKP